jgi:acetylglutamate/LysW-gamma-L-alpha-aminoadipate kinase
VALRAEALVILSNTPGLLRDVRDPESLIATVDVSDPASVEAAMTAALGRMKKKVEAGCKAVQAGIGRVVFADARVPQPIQRALAGVGTVLTAGSRVEVRP